MFKIVKNWLILIAAASLLAGCAAMGLGRVPVPEALVQSATIPDVDFSTSSRLRFWGDVHIDPSAARSNGLTDTAIRETEVAVSANSEINFLALSGGGYNGAFGTGYLLGWTKQGSRPEFQIVTGISVGALIAPFAFLGSAYDQDLLEAFEHLIATRESGNGVLGLIFGAAGLESSAPIARAIEKIITAETLVEIGALHNKGHRLLIGTTNLDVERPVIWDIGAIANSDVPNKVELVRQIILASSALPGIFPPVLIEVEAEGETYDELHVDGGTTQQVVLIPENLGRPGRTFKSGTRPVVDLYIIYNGKVAPDYAPVKASGMDILFRSIPVFIKSLGRADVKRLRETALQHGATYKLVAVPSEITIKNDFTPDPEYLQSLIKVGYEMGIEGIWQE